jgi:flavodoxin
MKKALIVYHSKTGKTFNYGEEIQGYMEMNGFQTRITHIDDFESKQLEGIDLLFLGCWTSGWMICMQHPERAWVEFAAKLPELRTTRIGLFTTYKLATGSMFRKMKSCLKVDKNVLIPELKSKNGMLSESDILILSGMLTV